MKKVILKRMVSCAFLIGCAFFVGISCTPEKTSESTVYPSPGTIGVTPGGGDYMPGPVDPYSLLLTGVGTGMSCTD